MPRREVDIQRSILYYLKTIGAYAGKTKTLGVKRGRSFCFDPYTFRGFPDITGFYRDKFFFCEAKAEKGKQTPQQKTFQEHCDRAGIIYILARSVDDVEEALQPSKAFPLT